MTPIKTSPVWRRIWVRFLMWEVGLRMRVVHGDPDVWLSASAAPADGSPWSRTRAQASSAPRVDPGGVAGVVEAEAKLRIDAVHDYFVGLRSAMRTRSVYSLHVMCRSTIEACAFSAWIFDPAAEPAERLLRGLLLRRQSLGTWLKTLEAMEGGLSGELDAGDLSEISRARSQTHEHIVEVKRAIRSIRADLESRNGALPERSLRVPSATERIREVLCDDMGLPQGFDAYPRMSGIAHSRSIAIMGTWNLDRGKPSIDYFSFLEFLYLAVGSIDFILGRRAACWGETHKSAGLHKILDRVEHIIEREPGVHLT